MAAITYTSCQLGPRYEVEGVTVEELTLEGFLAHASDDEVTGLEMVAAMLSGEETCVCTVIPARCPSSVMIRMTRSENEIRFMST